MDAAHTALLGVSVIALTGAGLRLASLSAVGLERVVAAAVYGCAAAVGESMVLALIGVGTDPIALTVAALATWLAAFVLLPRPARSCGQEFLDWLGSAPRYARAAVGALLLVGFLWLVWVLRHPRLGIDTIYYHLPQAFTWIENGTPGGTDRVNYLYEVQAYPLVHQILVSWSSGISQSLATVSVLPFLFLALFVTGGWVALRNAGVPVAPRAAAMAAAGTLPLTLNQLLGPLNDLPAVTWVVVAAALLLAAREEERRSLVAPAVIAAGLAAGTKTTALVPALMVLGAGAVAYRGWLRQFAPALGAAALAAVLVGGFWYLRDLVQHGSPFWPWSDAPWGDETPAFLERTYTGFIDRPKDTLSGRLDDYGTFVGAAPLLFGAGIALAAVYRQRVPRLLAAATCALVLLWVVAPSTAITDEPPLDGSISATRYLLPAFCASVAVLALIARNRSPFGAVAIGILLVALGINLVEIARGEAVYGPGIAVFVFGAILGAGLALVPTLPRRLVSAPVVGAAAFLLLTALVIPTATYSERYSTTGDQFDSPLIAFFRVTDQHRDAPIAMAPFMAGTLTGDDVQRRVELIPKDEPCDEVADRLEDSWVAILEIPLLRREVGYTVGSCLHDRTPAQVINGFRIYAPET